MSTTQHSTIQLPEKVQEAINLAQSKVEVLNEETKKLTKQRDLAQKELARLEIAKDTLIASLPELEQECVKLEKKSQELIAQNEGLLKELNEKTQSIKLAEKELSALQQGLVEDQARRSDAVEGARRATEKIEAERAKLQEEKEAFNKRKEHVAELLKSF